MSGIRTGNFFINSKLELRTLQLPSDQYRQMRRKSILLALNWLEENVLNRDDVGHHLREKTRNGVVFDEPMHRYLMNSCLHWIKTVKGGGHQPKIYKNKTRPYSSVHQKTKSPPGIIERPMTCPGREIHYSPIPVNYPKISHHETTYNTINSSKSYTNLRKPETYRDRNRYPSDRRRNPSNTRSSGKIKRYESNTPVRENIYRSKTYRSHKSHRPKNKTDFRQSIVPIRPKVVPKTGIYRNS